MPNGEYPPIHPSPNEDWKDDFCPVCGKLDPNAIAIYRRMVDKAVEEAEEQLLEDMYEREQMLYGEKNEVQA